MFITLEGRKEKYVDFQTVCDSYDTTLDTTH